MSLSPAPLFLIVGAPASGKSSTGKALAARFAKGLYVSVDSLREMVVSGAIHPGLDWSDGLIEQLALARESAVHMALAYRRAGFAVVLDDFWDDSSRLREYAALADAHRVLLYPTQETAHARNLARSGPGELQNYLDEGIRICYASLRDAVNELRDRDWQVLDNTNLTAEETVAKILHR